MVCCSVFLMYKQFHEQKNIQTKKQAKYALPIAKKCHERNWKNQIQFDIDFESSSRKKNILFYFWIEIFLLVVLWKICFFFPSSCKFRNKKKTVSVNGITSENYFCNFIGTTFTYLWTWLIIRFFSILSSNVFKSAFLSSRSSLQMMIIIWHFRFVATHKSLLKILSIAESIDLWQFVKHGSRKKYHFSRAPTNSFS